MVILVFHGMVAWYAMQATRFSVMFETPVLGWSEWVLYAPLAAGCADIVVTEAVHLVWQLRGIEVEEARAGILT